MTAKLGNMTPLTKKEEKLIVSLRQKKMRKQAGLFVVEGHKMVYEALQSDFEIHLIVGISPLAGISVEQRICSAHIMRHISTLKTPPGIMAIVKSMTINKVAQSPISLLLNRVQDPGNLGTIIRTAEALGVKSIILSDDTVDPYSPKVVQATMGSIFRMQIKTENLSEILRMNSEIPVYAAHLDGNNVYEEQIESPCYLLLGNESKGIDDELMNLVSNRIKIPIYGEAESFNVSSAAAILLAEFTRQLRLDGLAK